MQVMQAFCTIVNKANWLAILFSDILDIRFNTVEANWSVEHIKFEIILEVLSQFIDISEWLYVHAIHASQWTSKDNHESRLIICDLAYASRVCCHLAEAVNCEVETGHLSMLAGSFRHLRTAGVPDSKSFPFADVHIAFSELHVLTWVSVVLQVL